MHSELEKVLIQRFPKLFAQRYLDKTVTCLCWGIETGDGWYSLITGVCEKIEEYCKNKGLEQPEFGQIKEKFGGLRLYLDYDFQDAKLKDEYYTEVEKIVNEAENESYKICEECGTRDNVTVEGSWVRTLCKSCRRKQSEGPN